MPAVLDALGHDREVEVAGQLKNRVDHDVLVVASTAATATAVAAQVDTILGDKSYLRKLSEIS